MQQWALELRAAAHMAAQPRIFIDVAGDHFERLMRFGKELFDKHVDETKPKDVVTYEVDPADIRKETRVAVHSRASHTWEAVKAPQSARSSASGGNARHTTEQSTSDAGALHWPPFLPTATPAAGSSNLGATRDKSPPGGHSPFRRRSAPLPIGPKVLIPEPNRVNFESSSFAHAVAAGAYSLAFKSISSVEKTENLGVAGVASTMRERVAPVNAWAEPVRVHTETLGTELGIDWSKYLSRLDTEKAARTASGIAASARNSSAGAGSSAPNSERSSNSARGSARRKVVYTRDGRLVDNSMRSEEEAALIERVQGHSSLATPSASHPSVAKYIGEDGKALITPGSTSITPRSPLSTARASSSTPRTASRGVTPRSTTPRSPLQRPGTARGESENADLPSALAPAAFGLPSPAVGAAAAATSSKQRPKTKQGAAKEPAAPSCRGASGGVGSNRSSSNNPNPLAGHQSLEDITAAAKARRQTLSRPLHAAAAKFDQTGSGVGALQTRLQMEKWSDASFRRTHIDYRAVKRNGSAATLRELQNRDALKIPLHASKKSSSIGCASSTAGVQGSVDESQTGQSTSERAQRRPEMSAHLEVEGTEGRTRTRL